jgi:hypothetical protein
MRQPPPYPPQQPQYVVPGPPPGYIAVPVPMAIQWVPQRFTALTSWGLACSVAAFVLPLLTWGMNRISGGPSIFSSASCGGCCSSP